MHYVSTRGAAAPRDFPGVLLAGTAEDGGLFLPEAWPLLDIAALHGLPYADIAAAVLAPFVGDAIDAATLAALCHDAYAGFAHPAVVPLVQLDTSLFVAELFHGPTCAFKDLALQLVARLFDHLLGRQTRGGRIAIVGATSGDTGSAAIEAVRGSPHADIAVLHPAGRTSEVQRRQMTTVLAPNVLNIAIDGDFDDCQRLVKAMFADRPFAGDLRLTAVNSINWARIAAQIAYYVATALSLGAPARAVAFAVPTGNFGNVFAGWAARRMGLPVERLIIGSNSNDGLIRLLNDNDFAPHPVVPTLTPSMDIGVSSNLERLVAELTGRDGASVRMALHDGRLPAPALADMRALFAGATIDDAATLDAMRRWHDRAAYVADPHTAIGLAAAERLAPPGMPVIALATAHPAKFPDAVRQAIGRDAPVPPALASLYGREERMTRLPPDLAAVQSTIRAFVLRNAA